jgi:hypothetical protein
MPRIVVTTDPSLLAEDPPVLLDEEVHSVHLSTGHGAAQLVQRLVWAITDAEDAEHRDGPTARVKRLDGAHPNSAQSADEDVPHPVAAAYPVSAGL